jgi:hypothetical protein
MKRMALSTLPQPVSAGPMALVALLACLVPLPAEATIFGWVDSSGHVTYSNLPPPKGTKVIDTIQDTPVDPAAVAQANAAHEAQMQLLNERVRQLEDQLKQSQRAALPPTYAAAPPAPAAAGCDGYFNDCRSWDGPVYYTVGVPYLAGTPYLGPRHRHPDRHLRPPQRLAQGSAHAPGRSGAVYHR